MQKLGSLINHERYDAKMSSFFKDLHKITLAFCYFTFPAGINERQQQLYEEWYFHCTCQRCLDPSDNETWSNSLTCLQCAKPKLMPPLLSSLPEKENMQWKCQFCQAELENEQAEQIIGFCKEQWAQKILVG